jgi:hypothetical protein
VRENVIWHLHHRIEFFEADETRGGLVLALCHHLFELNILKQATGGAPGEREGKMRPSCTPRIWRRPFLRELKAPVIRSRTA